MQFHSIFILVIVALGIDICQSRVIEPSERASFKVFNYDGPLLVKDDLTGDVMKTDENDKIPVLDTSLNQTIDEAACWKLIVEESAITFAKQNRVLDELQADLKGLGMVNSVKDTIDKLITSMRSSMASALDALETDSPVEYFDSLFETSENIVQLSSLVRDSNMDGSLSKILIKAVSRLGWNNQALVQEFVDNCTILDRSQPRPRRF